MRFFFPFSIGMALMLGVSVVQSAQASLPEPLTLEYALSLALKSDHPELVRADAVVAGAEAEQLGVAANNGLEIGIVGGIKEIEPAVAASDRRSNDSYLKLNARKRLYDFGRTQADEEAAQAWLEGSRYRLADARQRRYLDVMKRFFDVLLADLKYARDNEAMAVAFVSLDKARDKVKLKQLSDIELLKLERDYQQVRRSVTFSANRQRAARSALSLALNRPGELSAELKMPELSRWNRPVPELKQLNRKVLRNNPMLKALKADLERESRRVAKAEASDNPLLSANVGATAYQRELGGYNPLSAELTLEIPLSTGGRAAAEAAKARSATMMKSADLKMFEHKLLQRVTDLWLELQGLKVKLDELKAAAEYRELKLDRNRALYEMEVNTDLGDSMVEISAQRLEEAETNFRRALVWAEIEALTGSLIQRH